MQTHGRCVYMLVHLLNIQCLQNLVDPQVLIKGSVKWHWCHCQLEIIQTLVSLLQIHSYVYIIEGTCGLAEQRRTHKRKVVSLSPSTANVL